MSLITFIVSPPQTEEIIQFLKESLLPIKKVRLLLLIQEQGKNGTHIHFNYLVETTKATDNLRKALYAKCAGKIAKEIYTGRNFLVIKKCSDINGLLSYYTKEPDYKVLDNSGNYDLENVKKWVQKTTVPRLFDKIIYTSQLVEAYVHYLEERQLDFHKNVQTFKHIEDEEKREKKAGESMLIELQSAGYNVINHWSKARALYCLTLGYYQKIFS